MGTGVLLQPDQLAVLTRLRRPLGDQVPQHPMLLRLDQKLESDPKAVPPSVETKLSLVLSGVMEIPFSVKIPRLPDPFATP
jgi:hypothetical protein